MANRTEHHTGLWPYQALRAHEVRSEEYLPGNIYLPVSQWEELVKKRRDRCILKVATHRKLYLLRPRPVTSTFISWAIIVEGFILEQDFYSIPEKMYRIEEYLSRVVEADELEIESSCLEWHVVADLLSMAYFQESYSMEGLVERRSAQIKVIQARNSQLGIASTSSSTGNKIDVIWKIGPKTKLLFKPHSLPIQVIDDGAYALVEELLQKSNKTKPNQSRGILLQGPSGSGKTFLVTSVCHNLGIPLITVKGANINGIATESAKHELDLAFERAQKIFPSVLFLDDLDLMVPPRENIEEFGVGQRMSFLFRHLDMANPHLVVIGATKNPSLLDEAIRVPRRLGLSLEINPPKKVTRSKILAQIFTEFKGCNYTFEGNVSFTTIAQRTSGFVPADLKRLHQEILLAALSSVDNGSIKAVQYVNQSVGISEVHIQQALRVVRPSISKEFQTLVEKSLTWDDIGGYEQVRLQLRRAVEYPLTRADEYNYYGIIPPRGILLYGPPGCSKTTIAKILANTGNFHFYSLNGADIFSAYVGEAERIIREIFRCARMTAPSLLFFDELDALVGKRGGLNSDIAQERVLTTFLTEMDGFEARGNVIVLGATNRLDAIDEALLRPGRFDLLVEVPLPNESEREAILRVIGRKIPVAEDVDYTKLAKLMAGSSGAELRELFRAATMEAIRSKAQSVTATHLFHVLNAQDSSL